MDVKNTGYLPYEPMLGHDFTGGDIPFESRMSGANWKKYLPGGQIQRIGSLETMNCTAYAVTNGIDTQLTYLYKSNKLSKEQRVFLEDNSYVIDGKVKTSPRFLGTLAGTTRRGNYLYKPAKAAHKNGVVPYALLPFDKEMSWEDYYSFDGNEKNLRALGMKFKELFNVEYEVIYSSMYGPKHNDERRDAIMHHLRHAPLQIAAPTCPGWSTDRIVQRCNRTPNHATQLSGAQIAINFNDFDSYIEFEKKLSWDYNIPFVLKTVVTPRGIDPEVIKEHKLRVKQLMAGRVIPYLWRPTSGDPDAHGEAYEVFADGSIKYRKGIPCDLFDSFIRNELLVGVTKEIWEDIKHAEMR